ncbi:MAG: MFS family permease [Chloroflexi bacterium]|jgi:MFS family permease|nr:MAG: MFS family permease [Chloroflexota bacterium]
MSELAKSDPLLSKAGPFSVLFNRNFRLLWIAGLLRFNARWMELIVLGWIILDVTNSPFLVGTLGFFRMAAMPILGLPAGIIADRLNRKLIILLAEGLNATLSVLLFVLVARNLITFWYIAVITLAMGMCFVNTFPSRSSLVQDLVGSKKLTNAMSLDMAAMTASKMVGPICGGLLLTLTGSAGATLALSILYILGFLFIIPVRAPQRQVQIRTESIAKLLSKGIRFVLKEPVLLGTSLITITANLFIFPFMVMIPVFARDVLQVNETSMGILAGADGLGALIGALFLASRRTIQSPGRIYTYGTIIAAITILLFSLSNNFTMSILLLMVSGLSFAGFTVMQPVLMLLGAPYEMRGRSMGVNMVAIGFAPIGFLLLGAMAEIWSAPIGVTVNCIIGICCMIAIITFAPAIRRKITFPDQEDVALSQPRIPT